jgi:hypothetical protein
VSGELELQRRGGLGGGGLVACYAAQSNRLKLAVQEGSRGVGWAR